MAQPQFFSWFRQSLVGPLRRRRRHGVPVRPRIETLEDRVVPSNVYLPLVNDTGLGSGYSIWVLGFSTTSQMELSQPNGNSTPGQFTQIKTANGTIPSYNISTMPSIALDTMTALTGARLYFFIEPGDPTTGPALTYINNGSDVTQPNNPPNNDAPYDIVEITVDGTTNDASDIHIDVQTVDGFIFPLTLTEENNLNQGLGQVGQTLNSAAVTRANIISAYTAFMDKQAEGKDYGDLVFGSIAGQAGGIVNPGRYLASGANSTSLLNSDWHTVLGTLFTTPSRTISMMGDDGDYYQGTPMQVGSDWVLHFVGYTDSTLSTPNGYVFNIYDPDTKDPLGPYQSGESPGEMVFANDGVFADTSNNVIVSPPPLPQSSPTPSIAQQPTSQTVSAGSTVVFTATAGGGLTPSGQWQFSSDGGIHWTPLSAGVTVNGPTTALTLSGVTTSMTGYEYEAGFNSGTVFSGPADLRVVPGLTPATVVLGLERDIVSALNRGVALGGQYVSGTTPAGYTSSYWGTETNWYPALTPGDGNYENLFSLFMHTGTVNGIPIFTQPTNPGPAQDAQGTPMGQAYGFAFDENPVHVFSPPPNPQPIVQPDVPSKFDPATGQAASITITLGPWGSVTPPPPSSSPSPPSLPSASAGSSSTATASLLFLAEDRFAFEVDSMALGFSNDPFFTQAADRAMSVLNGLFGLYNPALYTGLNGLQSAIYTNPYFGTAWGTIGQAVGFNWADHSKDWGPWTHSLDPVIEMELTANLFSPQNQS